MRDARYTPHELQAAHTILSYLTKHPASSDTVQGIVQWWCKRERLDYTEKQIRRALGLLIGRGLVTVKKYNRQQELYQMGAVRADVVDHAIEELAEHVHGRVAGANVAVRHDAEPAPDRPRREILSGRFYKLATWLLGMNWLLSLLKLNLILK